MAKRKKRNRGGGVPFNPDVDTGIKRPVTARVAVGDVNDKFSDYPSNGLTPRRLARIFREADEGNVRAQMELFEEMEEKDTHLFSQMQTSPLPDIRRFCILCDICFFVIICPFCKVFFRKIQFQFCCDLMAEPSSFLNPFI